MNTLIRLATTSVTVNSGCIWFRVIKSDLFASEYDRKITLGRKIFPFLGGGGIIILSFSVILKISVGILYLHPVSLECWYFFGGGVLMFCGVGRKLLYEAFSVV
jgi:hypothetical protein